MDYRLHLAATALASSLLAGCFAELSVGRYGLEHTVKDQAQVVATDKIPENAVGVGFAFGVQADWKDFVRLAGSYANALRDIAIKNTGGTESGALQGTMTGRADVAVLGLGERTKIRLTAAASAGERKFGYRIKDKKDYAATGGMDLFAGITLSHTAQSRMYQWLLSVGPSVGTWSTPTSGDLKASGVQGRLTFAVGPDLLVRAVAGLGSMMFGVQGASREQSYDLRIADADEAVRKLKAAAQLKGCTLANELGRSFTAKCKRSDMSLKVEVGGTLSYAAKIAWFTRVAT